MGRLFRFARPLIVQELACTLGGLLRRIPPGFVFDRQKGVRPILSEPLQIQMLK
jgi:hypothetical protein